MSDNESDNASVSSSGTDDPIVGHDVVFDPASNVEVASAPAPITLDEQVVANNAKIEQHHMKITRLMAMMEAIVGDIANIEYSLHNFRVDTVDEVRALIANSRNPHGT